MDVVVTIFETVLFWCKTDSVLSEDAGRQASGSLHTLIAMRGKRKNITSSTCYVVTCSSG